MINETSTTYGWKKGVKFPPGSEIPDDIAIAMGLLNPDDLQKKVASTPTESTTPTESATPTKSTTRKKRTASS